MLQPVGQNMQQARRNCLSRTDATATNEPAQNPAITLILKTMKTHMGWDPSPRRPSRAPRAIRSLPRISVSTRLRGQGATMKKNAPTPTYRSFADYLRRTTPMERMALCRGKASFANRYYLSSDDARNVMKSASGPCPLCGSLALETSKQDSAPASWRHRCLGCHIMARRREWAKTANPSEHQASGDDVWIVMIRARGRCVYCGSLCVEKRPLKANGTTAKWRRIGRRIGSLEHLIPLSSGGTNDPSNLAWSCLWCNTNELARKKRAKDHGGFHPRAENEARLSELLGDDYDYIDDDYDDQSDLYNPGPGCVIDEDYLHYGPMSPSWPDD
jgi:HNH endonuclease